ncbi:MAG: hypothetical protein RLZZ239_1727, partial [Pseudomonadota bacterium]
MAVFAVFAILGGQFAAGFHGVLNLLVSVQDFFFVEETGGKQRAHNGSHEQQDH